MILGNLFTAETIRARLGAMDVELLEEDINAMNLDDELELLIEAWLPDWDLQPEPLNKRVRLYLLYSACSLVASSAPGWMLRSWGDGEGTEQRFTSEYAANLSANMMSKANNHRSQIEDALGTKTAYRIPTLVRAVSPDRDPVTDPRATEG